VLHLIFHPNKTILRGKADGIPEVPPFGHTRLEFATVKAAVAQLLDRMVLCVHSVTVRRMRHRITRDIAANPLHLEQVVIISHSMILWPDEYY
jgi:hypothetical protein